MVPESCNSSLIPMPAKELQRSVKAMAPGTLNVACTLVDLQVRAGDQGWSVRFMEVTRTGSHLFDSNVKQQVNV